MSYNIVVARYNENIDWLLPEIDNCIIFNKGDILNIKNEILLDNVGRESDTYLNYIILNYFNLPDVVIFTQGNISDHKYSNNTNVLLNLKNDAILKGKSKAFYTHKEDTNRPCHHFDSDWNFKNNLSYLHHNYKNNKPIVFKEWFLKNIFSEYPDPMHIYVHGIFAVKKELILNHSLEYYKRLIVELNYHNDPIEGHFFERSWYYIFL